MPDEILEEVRRVLRGLGAGGALEPGTDLRADLELDSLEQLSLAVQLENRFRIRLDGAPEESVTTLGELVDAIRARLPRPPKAGAGS